MKRQGIALVSHDCCNKLPQSWWPKTTHFFSFSSRHQKSEVSFTVMRSRCPQGCVPSGGCREQSVSRSFQLLKATYISWLVAPFSIFKAHQSNLYFQCQWPSLWFCSFYTLFIRSLCATWIVDDNLKILNCICKIPFAMKGNIHRFQGLGCERICVAIIQPTIDILSPRNLWNTCRAMFPSGMFHATTHIFPVLSPFLDLGSVSKIDNPATSGHSYLCFPWWTFHNFLIF